MASHENTRHSCINCQITYLIWFSKPTYEVIREHNSSSAWWRPKWGSRAQWNSRNRAPNWHLSPHPQPRVLPSTQRPNMCSRLWLSWWKQSSQWTKFCSGNPSAAWPHIAVECVLFDIAMSNLKKLSEGLGKLTWGTAWHELLKLFTMEFRFLSFCVGLSLFFCEEGCIWLQYKWRKADTKGVRMEHQSASPVQVCG